MPRKTGRKYCARRTALLRHCVMAVGCGVAFDATARGLTINLSYDSSVLGLSYASSVESATQYAANQIDSLFSDNITVNINVTYDPDDFGESGTALGGFYTYAQIRSDLLATPQTAIDSIAYASLPASPDPTNGANFFLSSAEQKALG